MKGIKTYFKVLIEDNEKSIVLDCVRYVLLVLSGIYTVFSSGIRRVCFIQKQKLPIPVISVGNITWGGTGKTPLIALLIESVLAKGKKSAVLMRGYGNDEDVLLSRRYPSISVIKGKHRYKRGSAFLSQNTVDLFLLDDGFQQWRLHRDLDVITINCINPWGNRCLIPRGILRESLQNIARADIVVLTNGQHISEERKSEIKKDISQYISADAICEAVHMPWYFYRSSALDKKIEKESFSNKKAILFSGIGSPESFRRTIEALGITVVDEIIFEDHYAYSERDCETIKARVAADPSVCVITTEKDVLRSFQLLKNTIDPYVLVIKMEIVAGYEAFSSRLDRILGH